MQTSEKRVEKAWFTVRLYNHVIRGGLDKTQRTGTLIAPTSVNVCTSGF